VLCRLSDDFLPISVSEASRQCQKLPQLICHWRLHLSYIPVYQLTGHWATLQTCVFRAGSVHNSQETLVQQSMTSMTLAIVWWSSSQYTLSFAVQRNIEVAWLNEVPSHLRTAQNCGAMACGKGCCSKASSEKRSDVMNLNNYYRVRKGQVAK